MADQTLKQQAIFPDLPRNQPLLNKDGTMNDYWMLFFSNMVMALQRNLSPEGFVMPQQTTADINTYLTGTTFTGSILYDSTSNQFKGNIAGTWKVFTLT